VCGGRGAGGVSVCVNLQVGSVGRSATAARSLACLLACVDGTRRCESCLLHAAAVQALAGWLAGTLPIRLW
jgi:hypothetical protein